VAEAASRHQKSPSCSLFAPPTTRCESLYNSALVFLAGSIDEMPCFRGIDIFFATRTTNEKIPEFPHPDSSSVKVFGGVDLKRPLIPKSPTPLNGIPRSESVQKVKPTTSVYIPSIPGKYRHTMLGYRLVPTWQRGGSTDAKLPESQVPRSRWSTTFAKRLPIRANSSSFDSSSTADQSPAGALTQTRNRTGL
jgi:hypothetical protein